MKFYNNENPKPKKEIYVGKVAFERLKTEIGILYGSEFNYEGLTVIRDDRMDDNAIATEDPDLCKILDDLNDKRSS